MITTAQTTFLEIGKIYGTKTVTMIYVGSGLGSDLF